MEFWPANIDVEAEKAIEILDAQVFGALAMGDYELLAKVCQRRSYVTPFMNEIPVRVDRSGTAVSSRPYKENLNVTILREAA